MFSVAARRSAMVATRSPTIKSYAAKAAFSTQAKAQAKQVEDMAATMHWADVRDEIKEIQKLLNEPKTNCAIHIPENTGAFEMKVSHDMADIRNMIQQGNHDAVYAKTHSLKGEVKKTLYQF